ncbi:MAG: hypothetical protein WDZ72_12905 [Cyclobacteriaceae bacterium]
MNKIQLHFHHFFRYVWNVIFVLSYPILATFGILFVGITYFFSGISSFLSKYSTTRSEVMDQSEWKRLSSESDLIEGKLFKQIMFGPNCYHLRRSDGVPSVIEGQVFGQRIKVMDEGWLLEKWNTTDINQIPDFDICLYLPDEDKLTKLTNIKCFDWHLSEKDDHSLCLKWFDGIEGGEVKIAIV